MCVIAEESAREFKKVTRPVVTFSSYDTASYGTETTVNPVLPEMVPEVAVTWPRGPTASGLKAPVCEMVARWTPPVCC